MIGNARLCPFGGIGPAGPRDCAWHDCYTNRPVRLFRHLRLYIAAGYDMSDAISINADGKIP
jgi:hypothetical protein